MRNRRKRESHDQFHPQGEKKVFLNLNEIDQFPKSDFSCRENVDPPYASWKVGKLLPLAREKETPKLVIVADQWVVRKSRDPLSHKNLSVYV